MMKTEDIEDGEENDAKYDEEADHTNLIINYIPITLTEERLHSLFSAYGELESCKLMVDRITKQSLGYGFIKFKDPECASKAIEGINGKVLENKTLKVAIARPPSSSIQNANLYVSQLDPSVTREMLEQIFAPYGTIIEVKILYDKRTGTSRGVGFVRYELRHQAEAAIGALNGALLPDMSQSIHVKFADNMSEKMKRRTKGTGQQNAGGSNGAFRTNQMNFRYNPLGRYNYSTTTPAPQMMYDQSQYVDVNYQDPYAVAAAAAATTYPQQQYCLFICHLPPDTDENVLYRLFGPFGAIVSVKLARDGNGTCKGYGFVNYVKLEDAQQAILHMNGYQMGTKYLQVSFKTPGKKQ